MTRRLGRCWRAVARVLPTAGRSVLLLAPMAGFVGCTDSQDYILKTQAAQVAVLPARDQAEVTRAQKPDGNPVHRTVFESVTNPFPPLTKDQAAIRIRAHVNGVPILDDEVREACGPQVMAARTDAERLAIVNQTLDHLIDTEIMMQDLKAHLAKIRPQYMQKLKAAANHEFERRLEKMKQAAHKAGVELKTEEDVRSFLLKQNVLLDSLRRRTEREFMATEYMRSRVMGSLDRDVRHEDIVEYYHQHANQFELVDRVDWQDIFIDASKYRSRQEAYDFAVQLAQRAAAGEDFKRLAALYGADSIYRDGEGFGHLRREIRPPEAEPILFQLQPGQVGPVIELNRGFHVIRLVKRQYAGMRPLNDKTQEEIRHKLQNEVLEREYKRLLADLKSKAIIEKVPYTP